MNDYRHLLSPRTTNVVQDAGFLRRTSAFLIDLLVLDLFITTPLASLLEGAITRARHTSFTSMVYTSTELSVMVFLFVLIFAYFVLFEYLLGQTIGMMVVNTRVNTELTLWRALVRNVFIIPVFPFVALWLAEPVAILLWRRRLLEWLTNTRTLHERSIIL